jgi:Ca-activated chloride channel family protein
MTFLAPWMLASTVIVPVAVAVYLVWQRRRARRSSTLVAHGLVLASSDPSRRRALRHLPFVLFAAALALIGLAAARPSATVDTVQRQATVILAIDVSNSMAATDIKPSRLAVAEALADDFIREQPSTVRIGVVAFGDSALVVQPPSFVHAVVVQAVNGLSLGGGTSIEEGLLTSLSAISGKPLKVDSAMLAGNSRRIRVGYYGGSTIVLISDGENTVGTGPVNVARLAAFAGVRVQTIGVGTTAGTTMKIDSFTVSTALDAPTLEATAKAGHGSYHQAGDPAAAQDISKSISPHLTLLATHTEITAVFAAGAVLLLAGSLLISLLRSGRVF